MNKKILLTIIASCFLLNVKTEEANHATIDTFNHNLTKYKIDPSWVLKHFFSMNITELTICWSSFVKTCKEKPWFLTYQEKKDYCEKKMRDTIIAQCKEYSIFLENLYVHKTTKNLCFSYRKKPENIYQSVIEYWKKKQETSHYDFYAFYFDFVAMRYIENINNAYLNIEDKKYRDHATQDLILLNKIFDKLIKSSYESRYANHIKKYRDALMYFFKTKKND